MGRTNTAPAGLHFVQKGSRLVKGEGHWHRMSLRPDHKSPNFPNAPVAAPRGWLRAAIVAALALVFLRAAVHLVRVLSPILGRDIRPDRHSHRPLSPPR